MKVNDILLMNLYPTVFAYNNEIDIVSAPYDDLDLKLKKVKFSIKIFLFFFNKGVAILPCVVVCPLIFA